jgi:hypothetical protein
MSKYLTFTCLGFVTMLAWNVFLVQRDDKMFKAYYKQKADVEYCKDCK